MDIFAASANYLMRMLDFEGAECSSGRMKILLLDSETVSILSSTITQSKLLNLEIYLIDRLDNAGRERMRHLKCLCFVRPSTDAIQHLVQELREPKYGEYHIYFSNIVKKAALERLAEADCHELVRVVQEHFADYIVVNPDLFTLNAGDFRSPLLSSTDQWDSEMLSRTVEGVIAVLLSLKKKPLIRYERNSSITRRLAIELTHKINTEEKLFDFGRKMDTPPLLLILDRRNDPVTPLLSQWTYQAMVHELIGITNGRVNLSDVPDVRPELREIVLSQDQDPFFKNNMYLNFGDLGVNIKDYVDQYQKKTKTNMNIESISDMKRFVEDYPEFRKLSGNVSKHVTLVGELSRKIEKECLLEISELEQRLACNESHTSDLKVAAVQRMLQSPNVLNANKVRLVALYAIRYKSHLQNALPMLLDLLIVNDVPQDQIRTIKNLLAFTNSVQRNEEPLESESIFSRARSSFKGLKGVENVYTQHSPQLEKTLSNIIKGKLREQTHPFIEGSIIPKDKPQEILVFMVGGATFEEAKLIAQINGSTPGVRVVMGGSCMLNSKAFLEGIEYIVSSWDLSTNKAGASQPKP